MYVLDETISQDDFGVPFTKQCGEVIYDAVTRHGPWAMMTEQSYQKHGLRLGLGYGQKYVRNEDGILEAENNENNSSK